MAASLWPLMRLICIKRYQESTCPTTKAQSRSPRMNHTGRARARAVARILCAVQLALNAAALKPPVMPMGSHCLASRAFGLKTSPQSRRVDSVLTVLRATDNTRLARADALRGASAIAFGVVLAPCTSFAVPPVVNTELNTPPPVKAKSSPEQIKLAQHLKATGAKFFAAYWCPYCTLQREMFGSDGAQVLPYVECAQDGFQNEAVACRENKVEGFPSWQINGKLYPGLKSLTALQLLSGFDSSVTFAETTPGKDGKAKAPPGGFKPPAVTSKSSPQQVALAQHLKATGARFYGAYWCRYCNKQRSEFGSEATQELPYIECDSGGFQKDPSAAARCELVDAYPTWEIGGKFYGGYKSLDTLAQLSGFSMQPSQPAAGRDEGWEEIIRIEGLGGPVGKTDKDCTLSNGDAECKKK